MAILKYEQHPAVPLLLSLNAGFVDTAGFLALRGLFTAHVTGNFVTLGAALVFGTSGTLAKTLALPVYGLVVALAHFLSLQLPRINLPVLPTVLTLKVLLLIAAAIVAIRFGPFSDGDTLFATTTGLLLVSAMAIQNAAHRIHLSRLPPPSLMTGTTTQIMIDLVDLFAGPSAQHAALRARLAQMSRAVAAFALGCAAAALLYYKIGVWAFAIPPVIGALTLWRRVAAAEK